MVVGSIPTGPTFLLASGGAWSQPLASNTFFMETITAQIKDFIQYIALQFISDPKLAELRIGRSGDKKVNFRLVLSQPDVATVIGRQGFTASTIRSLIKAAAEREGVQVSLRIHSHEEERQYTAALEAKAMESQ